MTTETIANELRDILRRVGELSPAERDALLASEGGAVMLLQALLPALGIEKTAGVCGGSARIVRTRIPVWQLARMWRDGWRDVEILEAFPTLQASDLVAARQYALLAREEIDRDIAEQDAAMDEAD